MPINVLSNLSFEFLVNAVDSAFTFGEILSIYSNDKPINFVFSNFNNDKSKIYVKPIGSLDSLLKHGVKQGDVLVSIKHGTKCEILGPTISKVDGVNYTHINISRPSDVPDSILENRYNLISNFGNGKNWNKQFMFGTGFNYDICDFSFLSTNGILNLPNLSADASKNIGRAIKISNKYCLINKKDINYYVSNGVEFINRNGRVLSRKILSYYNIHELILSSNLKGYNSKKLSHIMNFESFLVCEFNTPFNESDYVGSVNFAEDIDSLSSSVSDREFLFLNNNFKTGLFMVEWNEVSGGFYRIINKNSFNLSSGDNYYSADYPCLLTMEDNFGMIFAKINKKLCLLGICGEDNFSNNSGTVSYEGSFLPDGKDFSNKFSTNLLDSGNFVEIKKISFKFDQIIVSGIYDALNYEVGSEENISIINNVELNSTLSTEVVSSIKKEFYGVMHTNFVGENLPYIIENKFENTNSYIVGSALFDRGVRPIVSSINQKGDVDRSVGQSYRPIYAYLNGQNKIFNYCINSDCKVFVPIENKNFIQNISSDKYSDKYLIKAGLKEKIGKFYSNQFKDIRKEKDVFCQGEYILAATEDGLKYVRKDGSISEIFRHDDAAVILQISSSVMSYISNNPYYNKTLSSYSLMLSAGSFGSSIVPYLISIAYTMSNGSISYFDYKKGSYQVYGSDIDILIYEIKRLISSIKSYYHNSDTLIGSDLVLHAKNACIEFGIKDVNKYVSNVAEYSKLVGGFNFYIGGLGETEVDAFSLSRKADGGISSILNRSAIASSAEIFGLKIYNTSSERSFNASGEVGSISDKNISTIWANYVYKNGSGIAPYNKKDAGNSFKNSVDLHIDASIDRWVNIVKSFDGFIDGYVVNCYDDVSFIDEDEIRARNFAVIDAANRVSKTLKTPILIGAAFSPLSKSLFRSKSSIYTNDGYIVNSERIIENSIKPSLMAGASFFVQNIDIDSYINDQFEVLDLYNNFKESSMVNFVRSSTCFFSTLYDSNFVKDINFYQIKNDSTTKFYSISLNPRSLSSFSKYLRIQGVSLFSNLESFLEAVMPYGSEFDDKDIQLDRFAIRSSVYHLAQDLISLQIQEVVEFINNNYDNYYITNSPLQQNANFLNNQSLDKNWICSNLFVSNNSFIKNGILTNSNVEGLRIYGNYFFDPFGSLSWKMINGYRLDREKKQIIYSSSLFENSTIEKSQILCSGTWGSLFNSTSESYSKGFIVRGGLGSNSSVNDLYLRWPKYNEDN